MEKIKIDKRFTEKNANKIPKKYSTLSIHNKVPFYTDHISKDKYNDIICW